MLNEFVKFLSGDKFLNLNTEVAVYNNSTFLASITMRQYSKIIEEHYDICHSNENEDLKLLKLSIVWKETCYTVAKYLFDKVCKPNLYKGFESKLYDSVEKNFRL